MFADFAKKAVFVSLSAAAALVNVAVAAPAQAADYDAARSQVVRYGDLDLTSAAGAATLHQRIARAAKQVCDMRSGRDLKMAAAEKSCRTVAIASAEPQVALVLAQRDTGRTYADAGTIGVVAN